MLDTYNQIDDLVEKIRIKLPPTEKDKELLLYKLNRQLTEDEHLHILTDILQTLEKRIYSMTDNCTLFDLNDLTPEVFWQIFYYAQLSIMKHETQKQTAQANQDDLVQRNEFNEKMRHDLEKYQKDAETTINLESLTPYERKRLEALSQCQYSTYSTTLPSTISNSKLALVNDKIMEKTIYSDTFQHRWKSNTDVNTTSTPTIIPIKPMIKLKSEILNKNNPIPLEINDNDNDDNDNDNDDEIENDFEEDSIEIERFKKQLLNLPKSQNPIGMESLDYEDADE